MQQNTPYNARLIFYLKGDSENQSIAIASLISTVSFAELTDLANQSFTL